MHILCSLCNLIIPNPFLTNATGHCIIMLWCWPLTLYYLTQAYNFIGHAPFYILNSSSVLTNRNKLHELRPEVCHKMSCIEGNCVKVATYYSLLKHTCIHKGFTWMRICACNRERNSIGEEARGLQVVCYLDLP